MWGVPQGCPLSMTLFGVGTCHIPERLGGMGIGASTHEDIFVGAETEDKLLNALHGLEDRPLRWA